MLPKIAMAILLGVFAMVVIAAIIRSVHQDLFFASIPRKQDSKVFFEEMLGTFEPFLIAFGGFFALAIAGTLIGTYAVEILGHSRTEAMPVAIALGLVPAAWWLFSGCGRVLEWIASHQIRKSDHIHPILKR